MNKKSFLALGLIGVGIWPPAMAASPLSSYLPARPTTRPTPQSVKVVQTNPTSAAPKPSTANANATSVASTPAADTSKPAAAPAPASIVVQTSLAEQTQPDTSQAQTTPQPSTTPAAQIAIATPTNRAAEPATTTATAPIPVSVPISISAPAATEPNPRKADSITVRTQLGGSSPNNPSSPALEARAKDSPPNKRNANANAALGKGSAALGKGSAKTPGAPFNTTLPDQNYNPAREGSSAQAQTAQQKFTATVLRALARNPELKQQQLRISAAKSRIMEMQGNYLPTVNLAYQAERRYRSASDSTITGLYGGQPIDLTMPGNTGAKYEASALIDISQNLYRGGADQAKISEAQSQLDVQNATYASAAKSLILKLSEAYWSVRKAQIDYELKRLRHEFAKTESVINLNNFNAGEISGIDLRQKMLDADSKEIELSLAKRHLEDERRKYIVLTNEAADISDERIGLEMPASNKATFEPDYASLFKQLDIQGDPELLKAQAEMEGAAAQREQIEAEYLPKVDLYARYRYAGRDDIAWRAHKNIGKDAYAVGVRAEWNIFQGFQTDQRLRQNDSQLLQGKIKEDSVQLDKKNVRADIDAQIGDLAQQIKLGQRKLIFANELEKVAIKRNQLQLSAKIDADAQRLSREEAELNLAILKIDYNLLKIRRALQ